MATEPIEPWFDRESMAPHDHTGYISGCGCCPRCHPYQYALFHAKHRKDRP